MANMGIGELGSPKLVFKRKFRWTFAVDRDCESAGQPHIPEYFVKIAARPNLTVEETEINFLNAKMFIPGKATWETITVTYLDVAGVGQGGKPNEGLWQWLVSVYDFTDPVTLKQASRRDDYTATGTLTLFDGCGAAIEQWTLLNMWPTNVQFGDLDYSSSDTVDIELTLRYSGIKYENFCPGIDLTGCCTDCSSD
jgi:hypothetical protein